MFLLCMILVLLWCGPLLLDCCGKRSSVPERQEELSARERVDARSDQLMVCRVICPPPPPLLEGKPAQ
eukprot:13718367-Alexandrium_andersonii.AAC.1